MVGGVWWNLLSPFECHTISVKAALVLALADSLAPAKLETLEASRACSLRFLARRAAPCQ